MDLVYIACPITSENAFPVGNSGTVILLLTGAALVWGGVVGGCTNQQVRCTSPVVPDGASVSFPCCRWLFVVPSAIGQSSTLSFSSTPATDSPRPRLKAKPLQSGRPSHKEGATTLKHVWSPHRCDLEGSDLGCLDVQLNKLPLLGRLHTQFTARADAHWGRRKARFPKPTYPPQPTWTLAQPPTAQGKGSCGGEDESTRPPTTR